MFLSSHAYGTLGSWAEHTRRGVIHDAPLWQAIALALTCLPFGVDLYMLSFGELRLSTDEALECAQMHSHDANTHGEDDT